MSNDERNVDEVREALDGVEVVTIDPAELMPAEEALRNYDTADDAVARFRSQVAGGVSEDAAMLAVVEAHDPGAWVLAEHAVHLYREAIRAGMEPDEARHAAVVQAADEATPRITAEQAEQVRTAFAADVVSEPDINNADRRRNHSEDERAADDDAGHRAQAETVDCSPAVVTESAGQEALYVGPTRGDRTIDTAPRGPSGFDLGDVVRNRRTGAVFTVAGDVSDWELYYYEPTGTAAPPGVPEREPEPGSWIARNLPDRREYAVPEDYEPDVLTAEDDQAEQLAYDRAEDGTEPYVGTADAAGPGSRSTSHDQAPSAEDTDAVLDRIDEVLAEPDEAPLARAVAEADQALHQAAITREDQDRAERCARWAGNDAVHTAVSDTSEGRGWA
ncbi:prolipoprotein diacylglyceryl transferase [Amycolatopsis alkalitolerans]|uniref:Uncharacterized protein n=1 Tax=Amycolatopsis alkalitolerans TaxID=2547244 RepID=A0A5C4LRW6_9PSEU|nr:hypothetical protein [Amycolatopsis alkalitolerans]TNC20896.1 hypothetical protein FG385_29885 [Amycolatopsis alkalitolerans]